MIHVLISLVGYIRLKGEWLRRKEDNMEIFYDAPNKIIGLKPTSDKNEFSISKQSGDTIVIHCIDFLKTNNILQGEKGLFDFEFQWDDELDMLLVFLSNIINKRIWR